MTKEFAPKQMVEKKIPTPKHKPFIRQMMIDQPFWHERQLIVESRLFENKRNKSD